MSIRDILAKPGCLEGQQAMALAMIYPDAEKGGRGKKSEGGKAAESAGFSNRRLREARSILRLAKKYDAERGFCKTWQDRPYC